MNSRNNNQLTELSFKCPKKWSDMTPMDNGRHCSDCNQVVHDFSKMNTDELTNQLNSIKETHTCGNFYAHQLKNPFDNWKDSIVFLYQKLATSNNRKIPFLKPVSLLLVTSLLIATGCHRKLRGRMVATKNCNKTKSPTVQTLD
ncbi:MAG: hypothetical protein H6586_01545 [Flavobacteriales bacterium]|nr:hypothetical protein [Flavobacteriales bacterium]